MLIQEFIPTGRNNAISRRFLSTLAGISDRDCREKIAEARQNGIPIIPKDTGGYYLPDLNNDIERYEMRLYLEKEKSRAKEILKSVNALTEVLSRAGLL